MRVGCEGASVLVPRLGYKTLAEEFRRDGYTLHCECARLDGAGEPLFATVHNEFAGGSQLPPSDLGRWGQLSFNVQDSHS